MNRSSTESTVRFRTIQAQDNKPLAGIIRQSIEDLCLPSEGTAHGDPTTDHLFELFQTPGAWYLVAEENGTLLGGCGLYPSAGLPAGCVELVRFFLHGEARGKGLGHRLMKQTIGQAIQLGYTALYLESFPDMQAAVHLYERYGFYRLAHPLGQTGHHACTVWMWKDL
jgi:putative acetyltransferase